MSYFITIDGGTTNTRVSLVSNESILDTVKLSGGAGAARTDGEGQIAAVRDAIFSILAKNHLWEANIERILASGMITSEFGLYNVPHAVAPVGLAELHDAMVEVSLPEVSSIPFVFLRGVRTAGDSFADADMMRGEETELMGVLDPVHGECVYVLPGSHSKVIKTDRQGRIETFSTLLTGEMVYALSQHTILGDAVDLSTDRVDEKHLLEGYRYCKENGINKALFRTRVLKNLFGCSSVETYSYFLGVALCDEVREILKYPVETVVIGGRAQLKEALGTILKNASDRKIVCLTAAEVDASVTRGQLRIYNGK